MTKAVHSTMMTATGESMTKLFPDRFIIDIFLVNDPQKEIDRSPRPLRIKSIHSPPSIKAITFMHQRTLGIWKSISKIIRVT